MAGCGRKANMQVTLKIKRYNPETDKIPAFREYRLEVDPTDRVLDALNAVKWYQDGTLAYRRSCAHGICGSDGMLINGGNRLACKVLIKDMGNKITIEPMRGFRVIKDLVVDMEPFFDKYKAIKPYLIANTPAPVVERKQSPEDRAVYDDTTKCILCACCTTSCPIFWANGEYLGPAAIVNAHRFIFDTRDDAGGERLDILNDRSGVWRCRTIFNCTEACPRGIDVTKAIEDVKRTLLFNQI
jgi:succinate dehydrogenase / fumarate reductase iron-sulfur subunit